MGGSGVGQRLLSLELVRGHSVRVAHTNAHTKGGKRYSGATVTYTNVHKKRPNDTYTCGNFLKQQMGTNNRPKQ
jgi:hypothetical protein